MYLGDVAVEVRGDGDVVHVGEALVDAYVTEIAIEEAETDGDTVIDGIELGEALGRKRFEAEREAGFGCCGARFGNCGSGIEACGEDLGELFGRDGAAIEPALADVAAEPEKHVGDGLAFDPFGNGGEAEAVAEADDGGGDLSALTGVDHGADEAGVDFELVEGK